MEHLTAVLEETENDMTAGEAANGQDDFEQGEKIRVDRRKLEQMLQGLYPKLYPNICTEAYLHIVYMVYISAYVCSTILVYQSVVLGP